MTQNYEVNVGRLYWGVIRRYVFNANARGYQITLSEGPGVLDRLFVISGNAPSVARARADIGEWYRTNILPLERKEAEEKAREQARIAARRARRAKLLSWLSFKRVAR